MIMGILGCKRNQKVLGTFVYISLILGTGVYISNVTRQVTVIRHDDEGPARDHNVDRVTRLRDQCRVLQDQLRSGQLTERQYPLSALLAPPSLDMVRLGSRHKLAVCVPYKVVITSLSPKFSLKTVLLII